MTGTITYILSRAGYRAMNGPLADERRRMAGAEPPAAYVSYDPRLLAGAGWYGYRIALKGGDQSMVERARYMLAERYIIRDGYEYYADGVYVFGVLLRERVPHYGIGGGAPTPEPDALNFYMPNGGTISLNKTGNPTVVELEYSIDRGQTWTVWQEDANGNRSLVLSAGQRMYVRNTSEISTQFSTNYLNLYGFTFTTDTYAGGNINSLLCKNPDNAVITSNCLRNLFTGQTTLITAPNLLGLVLKRYCYAQMFYGCTNLMAPPIIGATTQDEAACWQMFYQCFSLEESPVLKTEVLAAQCYQEMFSGCANLKKVTTLMTNISAPYCIAGWLNNVASAGDFYCLAGLTIPTGAGGIPTGWTRHDI